MARILVKFPSRGRPEKFFRTLARWKDFATGETKPHFLITLDEDDPTMNSPVVRENFKRFHPDCEVVYGKSGSKIAAVNRDMTGREGTFDIVVIASDDMLPIVKGYDERIASDMARFFPDFEGALHYYDGYSGDDHLCTLTIMGHRLYERFGYLYYPEYKSFFCDNEYTEQVKAWGVWKYIPDVIIDHNHPHRVRETADETYRNNDLYWRHDEELWKVRQPLIKNGRRATPLLSILIPTIESRDALCRKLMESLYAQVDALQARDDVEILTARDNKTTKVGEKRNHLLDRSRGLFVAFIDDDDDVSPHYVSSILAAIKANPSVDTITFLGIMFTDRQNPRPFVYDLKYEQYHDDNKVSYRSPNHLCPVKRDLAMQTKFHPVNRGEDGEYAVRLRKILRSQIHIDRVLYYYMYSPTATETQKPGMEP